jgi:GntR family transcriptional regulator/MocR family aminotransferase
MAEIAIPFEIRLEPASVTPLYRQLHDTLRSAILSGRLKPGQRLPSSRSLSAALGCSRNTVTEVYELLTAEGYLEGRIGAGSLVSSAFSDEWISVRPTASAVDGETSPPRLSRVARALLEMGPAEQGDGAAPRSDPASPDPDSFPFDLWARALGRAWRRPDRREAFRGDPMGYLPLRQAIADYLGKVRAMACDAGQVMITSGAQQALDLVARLLLDPGDTAWIEDPAYRGARAALSAAGAQAVPVPVDGEGFDAERAARMMPDSRLALVTPSHQFPLGVTMTLPRRMKLLDWAETGERWIVEDDYDSEFRYAGRPIPALQSLDRSRRVIYVGTFSKAMFPGLRLGYLVLPHRLVTAFRTARLLLDGHTSTVSQLALAEFIAEGHFAAHLRRMRDLYNRRREIMLEQVDGKLSPFLATPPGAAGMHLLIHLADGLDDRVVCRKARAVGVIGQPLSGFHAGPGRRQGLVLGFGGVAEDAIPGLVDRLAGVLADCR